MSTADSILSVTALDFRTLKVLFGNAGVPQLTVDGTALYNPPLRYRLAPLTAPAVTPNILSAESIGETGGQMLGVTIVADDDLSPGVTYNLIVNGITGISEDNIHNVGSFVSRYFDFPASRDFDLINYIPRINIAEDTSGELAKFIACLKEPLGFLLNDVDHWIDILDASIAPENFVDLMLEDLANPFVFSQPLSLTQKRRLAVSLVEIYKLKGTVLGCQTAIQFFLGMPSEFVPLNGLGSHMNGSGGSYHSAFSEGSSTLTPPHVPARLGSRRLWRFLCKVGTSIRSQTDAGQVSPSPAAGGPLTDVQRDQIARILTIMKPAYMIRTPTGAAKETGPIPSIRVCIKEGSGTVSLCMRLIADVTIGDYEFLAGSVPGVNQFTADEEIPGSTTSGGLMFGIDTPVGDRYYNGVGKSVIHGTVGLLSNEVTNALATPVALATAGLRKVTLSWGAISGATAYRIYRSSAAAGRTPLADNASNPIEISSDFTSFDDTLESGTTKYYIVTGVVLDAEGFMSNEVHATAL